MKKVFGLRAFVLLALAPTLALACAPPRAVDVARDKAPDDKPAPADPKPAKGAHSMPMFGGTIARNHANSVEKGVLEDFGVRKGKAKNIKWATKLGTVAYGGPVFSGGRIFVGTNNERPRDPAVKGDKGVVMCFRQSDGEFLWQITHDKLPDPEVNDFARQGVASTPCVEGDRLFYVSNRCEVVCADVHGDPRQKGKGKVLWKYDMHGKLGVFPCQLANCAPLILGDLVYVITGNGTNVGDNNKLEAPDAPSFIAINKTNGTLAWKSSLPGKKIMRGQWSNPAAAVVDGKAQVIFAGGDGWLYGLEAKTGDLIWKFDCNPKGATPYRPGGGGQRCFIIATPVVHDNKVYVAVGQEPDDGPGVGHLWCVDITVKPRNKDRDISPFSDPKDKDFQFDPKSPKNKGSGLVWHYGGFVVPRPKNVEDREIVFGRTLGTVAIHDGLVYASELAGYLHCLDAKTGQKYWEHDFQDSTWCSPYYVDGKVFQGTDAGDLYIFRAGKKPNKPKKVPMGGPVKVPPVALDGVLYANTGSTLYALAPAK
jgi:outer membrane protein assembly factor BamB